MSDPRIGLALGGGAARGLAHIPLLEVFDELGIKPAVIAGCSIGALVGAGYASGLSAKEIGEHARRVLGNRRAAARYVFGDRRAKFTQLINLKNIASLHINGETLAAVALPDGVAKRIEDTAIPFKIVTTDFETRSERLLTTGPMTTAVAASIAIPGLISGPRLNGHIHVDGGITNPVPFDHVRGECDIVVAIDVTGKPQLSGRKHPGNMELAIGSMLIMFHQIAALRRAQSPPDIYIEPDLEGFSAADFFRADDMMAAGAKSKDKLKRALELRLGRHALHGEPSTSISGRSQ
jgi:NTE family protein